MWLMVGLITRLKVLVNSKPRNSGYMPLSNKVSFKFIRVAIIMILFQSARLDYKKEGQVLSDRGMSSKTGNLEDKIQEDIYKLVIGRERRKGDK